MLDDMAPMPVLETVLFGVAGVFAVAMIIADLITQRIVFPPEKLEKGSFHE